MSKTLATAAVVVIFAATCFATDVPTLRSDTVRMSQVSKPGPVQPMVAVVSEADVIQVSARTIAVLEITGDPATGETTVKQLPIIGADGQPKQNELFVQTGMGCVGCNNPQTGSCTRTIRFDVDFVAPGPRYICDPAMTLDVGRSGNVTSISNPTWEGAALDDDFILVSADTYFGFDVLVADCTQRFQVYVNLEGEVSPNPCQRLEFELTWAAGNYADLDLRVDGPDLPDTGGPCSYELSFYNPISCGGEVEEQCNGVEFLSDCRTTNQDYCPNPREILAWDPIVHSGDYNVFVWAFALCGEANIDYTVRVFLDGVQQGSDQTGTVVVQRYWYTEDSDTNYIPLFTYTHP